MEPTIKYNDFFAILAGILMVNSQESRIKSQSDNKTTESNSENISRLGSLSGIISQQSYQKKSSLNQQRYRKTPNKKRRSRQKAMHNRWGRRLGLCRFSAQDRFLSVWGPGFIGSKVQRNIFHRASQLLGSSRQGSRINPVRRIAAKVDLGCLLALWAMAP